MGGALFSATWKLLARKTAREMQVVRKETFCEVMPQCTVQLSNECSQYWYTNLVKYSECARKNISQKGCCSVSIANCNVHIVVMWSAYTNRFCLCSDAVYISPLLSSLPPLIPHPPFLPLTCQREDDFLQRLQKHRFSAFNRYEDDYYGDKILTPSDYRQWIRVQQRKRDAAAKFIPQEGSKGSTQTSDTEDKSQAH